MLRSADYLLLNEATSNLGATSTALVSEAMDRLMKDCTTVMIARAGNRISDVIEGKCKRTVFRVR